MQSGGWRLRVSDAAWRVWVGRALPVLALVIASVGMAPWAAIAPGARAQETIALPPLAPGLSAPADGTILADPWGGVELHWTAVPGADDYQVMLNDGERTGPWVTDTSWSPGSLPEGFYRWSVRARNDAGVSEPGQGFTFTVAPAGADTSRPPDALAPLPFQLEQTADQTENPDAGTGDPNQGVPETAATPAAGTPVPVEAVTDDPALSNSGDLILVDGDDAAAPASDGATGADGANGADGENGEPGQPGQDGQPGADASDISVSDSDGGKDGKKGKDEARERDARERKDREERERPKHSSNGNGGVSEVIAEPLYYQYPVELEQQDASDASAGSVGESGTINGKPRETPAAAPVDITGPGDPLAPGEVMLPPSVPTVPGGPTPGYEVTSPSVNPALAAGIASTGEMAFDAVADTTVFTSAPDSAQSPESAALLAIGGPEGAVTLMSFDISGIGDGTVLSALLTFTGGGDAGAPGGSVGVTYGWVAPEGATANDVPSSESALNVHGAPAWFEELEPGGRSAADVSGSVSGDGKITFVLPGQPDTPGFIVSTEGGVPPQLVLTVAQGA